MPRKVCSNSSLEDSLKLADTEILSGFSRCSSVQRTQHVGNNHLPTAGTLWWLLTFVSALKGRWELCVKHQQRACQDTAHPHLEKFIWNIIPVPSFCFIKHVPGRCSQGHTSLSLSSASRPHTSPRLDAVPTKQIQYTSNLKWKRMHKALEVH